MQRRNNNKISMRIFTKINIIITIIILCMLCLIYLNNSDSLKDKQESVNNINSLWEETVSVVLHDKLWEDKYSYDATSYLLMPLQYAFKAEDYEKINEFRIF